MTRSSLLLLPVLLASCSRPDNADVSGAPVATAVRWIATHKDRAPGNGTQCGEDGFCGERIELPSVTIMSVALKEDPRAFAYGLFTTAAVTCAQFGAHRVVREWDSNEKDDRGSYHYVECELAERSLFGLRALISTSRGLDPQLDKVGHVWVFAPTPAVIRHLDINAGEAGAK